MKLGINSMGRIGKLSLWHHVARKHFSEIVINLGRDSGAGLQDVAQSMEKDSTYGRLSQFIHGVHAPLRVIENLDEASGSMTVNGVPVRVLRHHRNPRELPWRELGVRVVVDCSGVFLDPTVPPDAAAGSVRGHLEAGAEKVLVSAPFKIKKRELPMPEDATTVLMGINEEEYDPAVHTILSAASCTTTCLAFMVKPLIDKLGADRILSASMVTIHAATSSQTVLDAIPAAGATDLRKTRSAMNNIILTSTGAAKALRLVIPEMGEIGFLAESVRIPLMSGSLVILTLNLQSQDPDHPINRTDLNTIYQEAASGRYQRHLVYSEEQNVSADIVGFPRAGAIIEGLETHTRTAFTRINLDRLNGLPREVREHLDSKILSVPVTQATIYGWYDNELGSYANTLGDMTVHVAESLL